MWMRWSQSWVQDVLHIKTCGPNGDPIENVSCPAVAIQLANKLVDIGVEQKQFHVYVSENQIKSKIKSTKLLRQAY